MLMMSRGIRARLGLEGRLDRGHAGAKAAHHFAQHVVRGKTQPAVADLDRCMPIAQVIGCARQGASIIAAYFHQLFVSGDDAHDAAIGAAQAIAAAQDRPALEEQADFLATGKHRAQAAFLALLERQDKQGVLRRLRRDALFDYQHQKRK